jgi:hypothetical protein
VKATDVLKKHVFLLKTADPAGNADPSLERSAFRLIRPD